MQMSWAEATLNMTKGERGNGCMAVNSEVKVGHWQVIPYRGPCRGTWILPEWDSVLSRDLT